MFKAISATLADTATHFGHPVKVWEVDLAWPCDSLNLAPLLMLYRRANAFSWGGVGAGYLMVAEVYGNRDERKLTLELHESRDKPWPLNFAAERCDFGESVSQIRLA